MTSRRPLPAFRASSLILASSGVGVPSSPPVLGRSWGGIRCGSPRSWSFRPRSRSRSRRCAIRAARPSNSECLAFLLHVFDLKQLLRRKHGAKFVQFFVRDGLQSGNRLLELWRILVPDAITSFSMAACNNFPAPSCSKQLLQKGFTFIFCSLRKEAAKNSGSPLFSCG
jgi:hypothetical protein